MAAFFGCKPVIERGKDHIMPDLATVAYRDSAVILKMAAGIDEYMLAYGDVFPEIRIKRRENAKRLRYFITEQLGKQFRALRPAYDKPYSAGK